MTDKKTDLAEKLTQAILDIPAEELKNLTAGELAAKLAEAALKRAPRKKPAPVKKDYTREELIALCEVAIVPMGNWLDRDSYSAHKQVGKCWALMKAGVPFEIEDDTDDRFINIRHYDIEGFNFHEEGGVEAKEEEHSYLPTPERLVASAGSDWYG